MDNVLVKKMRTSGVGYPTRALSSAAGVFNYETLAEDKFSYPSLGRSRHLLGISDYRHTVRQNQERVLIPPAVI